MPRHSEATRDAIKQAVDLVALAGEYGLQLHRSGSKYKALCPFHDDHDPSLTLDPDRQTYRCWACGASGDIFTFVQAFERVDFPEALRMLAERAGIALETAAGRATPVGPSKADLLAGVRLGRAALRRRHWRVRKRPGITSRAAASQRRASRGSGSVSPPTTATGSRTRRVARGSIGSCWRRPAWSPDPRDRA